MAIIKNTAPNQMVIGEIIPAYTKVCVLHNPGIDVDIVGRAVFIDGTYTTKHLGDSPNTLLTGLAQNSTHTFKIGRYDSMSSDSLIASGFDIQFSAPETVTTRQNPTIIDYQVVAEYVEIGAAPPALKIQLGGYADTVELEYRVGTGAWAPVWFGTFASEIYVTGLPLGTVDLRLRGVVELPIAPYKEKSPWVTIPNVTLESTFQAPAATAAPATQVSKLAEPTERYDVKVSWSWTRGTGSDIRHFILERLDTTLHGTDWTKSEKINTGTAKSYTIVNHPFEREFKYRVTAVSWGPEDLNSTTSPETALTVTSATTIVDLVRDTNLEVNYAHIKATASIGGSPKQTFLLDAATGSLALGKLDALGNAPVSVDGVNGDVHIDGKVITESIYSANFILTNTTGASNPSLHSIAKPTYTDESTGIYMGHQNDGSFRFNMGNAANYIKWDGSSLDIQGKVTISGGSTGFSELLDRPAQGINYAHPVWCTDPDPSYSVPAQNGVLAVETANIGQPGGGNCLALTCTQYTPNSNPPKADCYVYLHTIGQGSHNLAIPPNKAWMISAWVKTDTVGTNAEFYFRGELGQHRARSFTLSTTNWTQVNLVLDISDWDDRAVSLRLDVNKLDSTVWFDQIMLEPVHADASPDSASDFVLPISEHNQYFVSEQSEEAKQAAITEANAYANANFVDQVSYATDIQAVRDQIDKSITTWFFDGAPTLTTQPAVDWATNADKDVHLGDLYYDNLTGYSYRFKWDGASYSWLKLSDADVTAALTAAATAQDTADSKRRVFFGTPVPPYDKGDLWDTGNGLKRATVSSTTTYAAGDWIFVTDAHGSAEAAKVAAINAAETKANTAEVQAKAYADGIVTAEEQRAIADAQAKADAAQQAALDAALSQTNVGWYSGFEDGEPAWVVGTDNSAITSLDKFSGAHALELRTTVTAGDSTGPTSGTHAVIPEKVALAFVGRRIRVTAFVKFANTNPSTEFAIAYSTAEVGNSEWRRFTPTADYRPYSFTYDVPNPNVGGSDFIGIWASTSGLSKGILVDNVRIDVVSDVFDVGADVAGSADAAQVAAIAAAETKANTAEVQAKAYADGIVTAEEQRAIADAQAKADAAQQAAIDAAASDASSKVSALEVGGRNLLRGSATDKFYPWSTTSPLTITSGSPTYRVRCDINTTSSAGVLQHSTYVNLMRLVEGDEYTLSFEVIGTVGLAMNYVYIMHTSTTNQSVQIVDKVIDSETVSKRMSVTFTKVYASEFSSVLIGVINANVGEWFEVSSIKIERGSKATDWTPAPEDVEAYAAAQAEAAQIAAIDAAALDASAKAKAEAQRVLVSGGILPEPSFRFFIDQPSKLPEYHFRADNLVPSANNDFMIYSVDGPTSGWFASNFMHDSRTMYFPVRQGESIALDLVMEYVNLETHTLGWSIDIVLFDKDLTVIRGYSLANQTSVTAGLGVKEYTNKHTLTEANVASALLRVRTNTLEAGAQFRLGLHYCQLYRVSSFVDNDIIKAYTDNAVGSTDVEYYLSTSNTALAGGSWQTTAPAWVNGKYMWSRTKVTTLGGVVSYVPSTTGTCIAGATGNTGNTGRGVSAIKEQYYLSTSKTTRTGGSWSDTPQAWENGKYIWTRSHITYTTGTPATATTTPLVSSEWEAVNEVSVGGTNLIVGTRDASCNSASGLNTAETYKGFTIVTGDNGTGTYRDIYKLNPIDVSDSNIYTLSFYARGNVPDAIIRSYFYSPNTTIKVSNSDGYTYTTGGSDGSSPITLEHNVWKRYWVTWEQTDTVDPKTIIVARAYADVSICGVKFEKGNKATDWTPAPEDVEAEAAAKAATAKQEAIDVAAADATTKANAAQQAATAEANDIALAATQTTIDGGLVTTGGITLDGISGYIRANKADYNAVTPGVWLGKDANGGALSIGDGTDYIKYNAVSGLEVQGKVTVGAGSTGFSEFADKPADSDLLNYSTEGGVTRIARPVGGSYSSNGDTGAFKIRLPQFRSETMLTFVVDIYDYATGKSVSIYVAGYNYTNIWYNCTAITTGGISVPVRFGNDGVKDCVWIGELNTAWSYPKVSIRDVTAGFANFSPAQWATGWSISVVTAFNTVDHTFTKTNTTQTVIDGGLITTGGITLDGTTGFIRAGKTGYTTNGSGFWVGQTASGGALVLGDANNYLYFRGDHGLQLKTTDLEIGAGGSATFRGNINAGGGRFKVWKSDGGVITTITDYGLPAANVGLIVNMTKGNAIAIDARSTGTGTAVSGDADYGSGGVFRTYAGASSGKGVISLTSAQGAAHIKMNPLTVLPYGTMGDMCVAKRSDGRTYMFVCYENYGSQGKWKAVDYGSSSWYGGNAP